MKNRKIQHRTRWVGCWLLLGGWFLVGSAVAGEVRVGDSSAIVEERLGAPQGVIETPSVTWWYYERGRIQMVDDEVVAVALISAEEAAARAAQRAADEQRRRAARAAQQEQRRQAGYALKQARLQDPYFMNRPAREQVDFWREFQVRYPEIPVHAPYAAALERQLREEEQAQRLRDQERRLAELERRVQAAEARTQPVGWSTYAAPVVYHRGTPGYYRDRRQSVRVVGGTRTSGARVHIGHSSQRRETRTRPVVTDPSRLDRVFGPWPTSSQSPFTSRQRPAGTFGSVHMSTGF